MGKQHGHKRSGKHSQTTSNKRNVRKKPVIRDDSSKRAPVAPNTAPMPAVKTGFVIKCKNDDPNNRYQLVVKGQIANRVYVVLNTKFNKEFCMKVEPFNPSNELKQLKRDLFVLCDSRKYPSTLGSHFLPITNKGCVDDVLNYIVMPLGEGNLLDIRKNVVCGDFCLETAVRLALETFQAINDLHSLSYIHRAIGPAKFIVGPEGTRLYMVGLSLSMCMYKVSKSNPKHIHKYGSSRFQSCNWHKRREQFYRDDLESWAYMAIDLFGQNWLPWSEGMLDVKMLEFKEQFMRGDMENFTGSLPQLMKTCMLKISEVRETEKPDYRQFKETLLLLRKEVHCEMKGPYNWASGKPKDSKREKVQSSRPESPFVNDEAAEKEKEDMPKEGKKSKSKSKSSTKSKKDGSVRSVRSKKQPPPKGMNVQMILEQMPFVTLEDGSVSVGQPKCPVKESPKRTDSLRVKKKKAKEEEKEKQEEEEPQEEKKAEKKFDEEEYEPDDQDEAKKRNGEAPASPASAPPQKLIKQSGYLSK